MTTEDNQTARLAIRLAAHIDGALATAAERNVRTKSSQVRKYVVDGLRRDGLLENDTRDDA